MSHAHGFGSGFALIVVLFILLVIIGASYVGYGY
ncbi:YjcZ family sporulation protein [Anaerobacillus sp. CMMVII]|nr:YjcZ family sporulation protein [Anaerobacillus sp. CMMVII]MCT8137188.1 YjcZ family sporulation protein [Anaerobacillus sp. CMMVII]